MSEYRNNTGKFSSMINSPYKLFNKTFTDVLRERSVESPYTSLESGQSSYASISHHGSYDTLKAKAEKASMSHDIKSRAVMKALQSLQDKICRLESDRAQAETNLKSLATETRDYKELLQQNRYSGNSSELNDSHTKELEGQLDRAQNKCQLLEKQLDFMRNMFQNHRPVSHRVTSTSLSPVTTTSAGYGTTITSQLVSSPTQRVHPASTPDNPCAMIKLNDLEREHVKLSASQNLTESKIKELEEKIREEQHHRKLLQDKAAELQSAVAINKVLQAATGPSLVTHKPRTKVKKKKKIISSSNRKIPSQESAHYHLDLANIPFVVGQSTKKSHSLGANIQNVLSIMKSHNRLCSELPNPQHTSHKRQARGLSLAGAEMKELLVTLQDEFAQLGFEHRELCAQLNQVEEEDVLHDLEREMERIVQKMEAKGKQIHTIRDHLGQLRDSTTEKRKSTPKNKIPLKNGQEVEVVTTVRATGGEHNRDTKKDVHLDMLKKVKKLQTTLRKDDLNWE